MQDLNPTPKQLSYLSHLAFKSGSSYAYPHSRSAASREIRRMKARAQTPKAERRQETKTVRGEVAGLLPPITDRLATSSGEVS